MRVESPAGMGKPSSDHPEARLGQVVLGKWTLESVLGTGGMAAVYLARHAIGRREAIKILHPEVARDAEQRKRFDQEARAANELGHPGAVEIRDVDITEDGCPFMVMELLEGETLGDLANRQDGLPLGDLLRYADEVLDVLAAAHQRGIVHRDIKLGNLFLTREGKIKVLDFGIARIASSHITRAGARLGTTAYMPPEQIRGEAVDGRADLFAVGATMFRIIAKRRVHEAKTEVDLIAKMAMNPAPMLATVCDAPADVCLVVDRALAFRVAERYPDARTMQLDVQALRRGESPPYAAGAVPASKDGTRGGATRADAPHRRPIDSNAATVAPPKTDVAVSIPMAAAPPSRLGFEPTGISSDEVPSAPDSVRVRVTPAVRGDEATGYAGAATVVPVRRENVGFEPTSASARAAPLPSSQAASSRVVGSASSRVVGSAMPTIPDGLPVSARGAGTPSAGTPSVGSLGASSGMSAPASVAVIAPVSIARSATPVDVAAQTIHGEPPAPAPASAWGVPPVGKPAQDSKKRGPILVVVVVVLLLLFGAAVALGFAMQGDESSPSRKPASTTVAPPTVAPLQPVPATPQAAPTTPGAKRTPPPAAPPPAAPPPAKTTPPPAATPAAPATTAPAAPPPSSKPSAPPPPATSPTPPPPPPPATQPGNKGGGKGPKGRGKGNGKDDD